MGITKVEKFTRQQNEMAILLKAMAHPARIAILQYLIKKNVCINGDLIDVLGLAQATISQHLKELKAVGLIKGTIEGSSICYCINPVMWKRVKSRLDQLFVSFNDENHCC